MSDPGRTVERNTRDHEMKVLRDDGLYRHIRFQQPSGTNIWRFDLVTWPGHLVITGDLEDLHFARLPDMFQFFRSPTGRINADYWAEKLRGPVNAKRYSPDRFKQLVFEYFWENRDELRGPDAPLWRAIVTEVLPEYVSYDNSSAHAALHDFSFRGWEFSDSYEWDLTDYDFHYLVALHAIVWGINKYDKETASE